MWHRWSILCSLHLTYYAALTSRCTCFSLYSWTVISWRWPFEMISFRSHWNIPKRWWRVWLCREGKERVHQLTSRQQLWQGEVTCCSRWGGQFGMAWDIVLSRVSQNRTSVKTAIHHSWPPRWPSRLTAFTVLGSYLVICQILGVRFMGRYSNWPLLPTEPLQDSTRCRGTVCINNDEKTWDEGNRIRPLLKVNNTNRLDLYTAMDRRHSYWIGLRRQYFWKWIHGNLAKWTFSIIYFKGEGIWMSAISWPTEHSGILLPNILLYFNYLPVKVPG